MELELCHFIVAMKEGFTKLFLGDGNFALNQDWNQVIKTRLLRKIYFTIK